ncbi:MAG: CDF family Co(II)/Ni(II) efflux transporter DmeF [Verrucomicrobiota bacterium]
MHKDHLQGWKHDHSFGQDQRRSGETRSMVVIAITATMMVVEIVTGLMFGSMALLADGLHMASHAAALTINVCAYVFARRHAHNPRFSFGTGKVNALGGFTGAILLAGFALLMAWESFHRLIDPVEIVFNQAIMVAMIGLLVNGICVFILGNQGHHHGHDHHHDQGHADHHHDHNLRSAYLHVLADALTSILAIIALITAKYFGSIWMDPLMGILGSILVARWSWGLILSTSKVLLDQQGPEASIKKIRRCIEQDGDSKVADIHLWSIGPGIYSLILSVVAQNYRSPEEYKERFPDDLGLKHISIEVHHCVDSLSGMK